tara:strand:- start:59003 stop:60130 length:1128 start_codon:yes stop_codon:yes gene_type:complete
MKSKGYDVAIASSPGHELEDFGDEEGVAVHAVSMERRIAPLSDLVSLAKLLREIREIRPEIVHSHTPKGGLLGMCAATLAGVPVRCYHLRGLPMMSATGPKRTLLRWTERLSCLLADEVFCVSSSLREVALSERLCPASKIHVLAGGSGNGVDSTGLYNPKTHAPLARDAIRAGLDIRKDQVVVGFVGRMVGDKGVVELAKAWKTVRGLHSDALLLLIGPREASDAVPPDILEQLDSDSRVRWVDTVANVAEYYAAMDLVVLPTYREGLPNVLLEAAAMQLPVVATEVPGCVDVVVDGVTGMLVPPQTVEPLAKAIDTYLSSSELRREHGTNARVHVVANFSQEKIWQALSEHYEALCNEPAAQSPGSSSAAGVR